MKEQLSKMRAYFESGVTYDYEFRAEKSQRR